MTTDVHFQCDNHNQRDLLEQILRHAKVKVHRRPGHNNMLTIWPSDAQEARRALADFKAALGKLDDVFASALFEANLDVIGEDRVAPSEGFRPVLPYKAAVRQWLKYPKPVVTIKQWPMSKNQAMSQGRGLIVATQYEPGVKLSAAQAALTPLLAEGYAHMRSQTDVLWPDQVREYVGRPKVADWPFKNINVLHLDADPYIYAMVQWGKYNEVIDMHFMLKARNAILFLIHSMEQYLARPSAHRDGKSLNSFLQAAAGDFTSQTRMSVALGPKGTESAIVNFAAGPILKLQFRTACDMVMAFGCDYATREIAKTVLHLWPDMDSLIDGDGDLIFNSTTNRMTRLYVLSRNSHPAYQEQERDVRPVVYLHHYDQKTRKQMPPGLHVLLPMDARAYRAVASTCRLLFENHYTSNNVYMFGSKDSEFFSALNPVSETERETMEKTGANMAVISHTRNAIEIKSMVSRGPGYGAISMHSMRMLRRVVLALIHSGVVATTQLDRESQFHMFLGELKTACDWLKTNEGLNNVYRVGSRLSLDEAGLLGSIYLRYDLGYAHWPDHAKTLAALVSIYPNLKPWIWRDRIRLILP